MFDRDNWWNFEVLMKLDIDFFVVQALSEYCRRWKEVPTIQTVIFNCYFNMTLLNYQILHCIPSANKFKRILFEILLLEPSFRPLKHIWLCESKNSMLYVYEPASFTAYVYISELIDIFYFVL